jgi:ADP-ribosyl-[dinitrogen reductase] hydrolase
LEINGADMRISSVGFTARTESEACRLSEIVTGVTHNHDEGIKGAEATAVVIFMARRGFTKSEIRNKISRNYYPLNFTIDEIRDTYQFNETCQETVPQAIVAFLESTSFEDAIRIAISVGGDSDTLAATGSIAEAYYGVPEGIKEMALTYLDSDLRLIYDEWCEFAEDGNSHIKFKMLTKYIGKLSDTENFGEWFIDGENEGSSEHPIQMPFVNFDDLVYMFVEEFYQFSESYPEYQLSRYSSILENNGLKWNDRAMG